MRRFGIHAAAIAALFAGAASAGELRPNQGAGLTLGEVSGVAYYTEESDGYRVVATLAAGEGGTPMRFTTTLALGQKAVLSVPGRPGSAGVAVEIRRVGDRVLVTDAGPATN